MLMLIAVLLTGTNVFAYDFEANGIYYNITSPSNLEVEVTSPNKADGYHYPSYASSYSVTSMQIPETVNYNNRIYTVTGIGHSAFFRCTSLTTVAMPKSIVRIGGYAFMESGITSIEIPEKVTSIGGAAFYDCDNLDAIIIPNSVTSIEIDAFYDCDGLKSVVIGKGVTSIGYDAFRYCSSLMEVFFLPISKPTIDGSAFYNCHSALERYVPNAEAYGFGTEYISFGANSFQYSGNAPTVDWNNNLKAYTAALNVDDVTLDKNAGTHTATFTATYSNGIDIQVEIPYTYEITKSPLTLTVNNCSREYGLDNPAFTCEAVGFVEGESLATLSSQPAYTCEATKKSNVGDYRVLATLEAPNYEVTYNYGTLSIVKAPVSLTVKSASKVYGNANPRFEFLFSELRNGETSPVWTTTPTTQTVATIESPCGTYPVTASGGVATNYEIAQYIPGELTVTKRDLEIKVNDCTRMYGDANPEFTFSYTGFVNNDTEASLSSLPEATTTANNTSGVGKYEIIANGADAVNYSISLIPGFLTVKAAEATLTPKDASRAYGDENPVFEFVVTGLKNNETAENILLATPKLTTLATVTSQVGTYAISASGGSANNYTFKYGTGNLTVTKAPLTATPDNITRKYGDSNPVFTASYVGLKNNESSSQIFIQKPTITSTATKSSGVGTYPIAISGGVATNYDITHYNTGELTVTKRDLKVVANDCSKVYGENNPEFTLSYSGFANSDNKNSLKKQPQTTCGATKESNAGTYSIVVSGGEADNYSFVYVNGTLTIKPITIGFKEVYNTVKYNEMDKSVSDVWFEYVPEISGEWSKDDFNISVYALDAAGSYNQHEFTISGGNYAGKYINYSGPTYVGKYVIDLVSKGTNPNVTAEPSRAYLTVTKASNNFEWEDSDISVEIGKTVDLGISYEADIYCQFSASYDKTLIKLDGKSTNTNDPKWSITGLKEGTTTLTFGIINNKNEWGNYNFSNPSSISKTITVLPSSGIQNVNTTDIRVLASNGNIIVEGTDDKLIQVYDINGSLLYKGYETIINMENKGVYIVIVNSKSFKIML